jgi:hypothetical protein
MSFLAIDQWCKALVGLLPAPKFIILHAQILYKNEAYINTNYGCDDTGAAPYWK